MKTLDSHELAGASISPGSASGPRPGWEKKKGHGSTLQKDNEQYAYFTMSGDFSFEEITARAGCQPSEAWNAGDVNPKSRRERRFSRWSLSSRLGTDQDVEAHVGDVLDQLDGNPQAFLSLSREFGGWIQIVEYIHAVTPSHHFAAQTLMRLARYEVATDIDIYFLQSDRREDE
jgi:hypothetical protein